MCSQVCGCVHGLSLSHTHTRTHARTNSLAQSLTHSRARGCQEVSGSLTPSLRAWCERDGADGRSSPFVCLFVVWIVTGKGSFGPVKSTNPGGGGTGRPGRARGRRVGPHNGAESGERVGG